jgi:predicted DNA binding CopG/RHH family protein
MNLEKRPWHYARDYLQAQQNKDRAAEMGIPVAAQRHKEEMQRIWASIPEHLLEMVKTHINNERAKHEFGKFTNQRQTSACGQFTG